MAKKKAAKKRGKATLRPAKAGTDGKEAVASGAGGIADTVPHPTAGENPAFGQWVGEELSNADSQPSQPETGKRPPGRPPGTGKNQRAAAALNEFQAAGLDDTILAAVWKGVFQAAALIFESSAMLLSDQEAIALARPSCIIWGCYMPTMITPVQAAWSQLGMVLFGVIGTRADVIRQGWKRRAGKAAAAETATWRPVVTVAGESKPDIPTGNVKFTPAKGAEGSA